MAMSTAALRAAWAPPCTGPWARVNLYGAGVVTVRASVVDAVQALNAVLAKWNYKTRRSDTGGYVCRAITGGSNYSLHAYGIAIDINWQSNAYGKKLVTDMPRGMVNEIIAIRTNNGKPVWSWGGDWSSVKDAMHYQIDCTPQDLATGIKKSGAPKPVPPKPTPKPSPEEEEDMLTIISNKGKHRLCWGLFFLNLTPADSDFYAFLGTKRDEVPDNFWATHGRNAVEAQNVNVAAFYGLVNSKSLEGLSKQIAALPGATSQPIDVKALGEAVVKSMGLALSK